MGSTSRGHTWLERSGQAPSLSSIKSVRAGVEPGSGTRPLGAVCAEGVVAFPAAFLLCASYSAMATA
jgi:hypothetical protein